MKNTTISFSPDYIGYNVTIRESITDLTDDFERNDMIVLDNVEIPDFPYDYWINEMPTYTTKNNRWEPPMFAHEVLKEEWSERHRLFRDLDLDEEKTETFRKMHRRTHQAWLNFQKQLFPNYEGDMDCLSHRYNTLVYNRQHIDLLDGDHTGDRHQLRMAINVSNKPRMCSIGEHINLLFDRVENKARYKDMNIHDFIFELRNEVIWNGKHEYGGLPISCVIFPPKTIWVFNSNVANHSLIYGEKLQMWETDIDLKSMKSTANTIPELVKKLQAGI
jgi:hypothetical protein